MIRKRVILKKLGIAMIVLPGPAIRVVPLGLTILGIEFLWARGWLAGIRSGLQDVNQEVESRLRNEHELN